MTAPSPMPALPGPDNAAAVRALLRHPRFPDAMRHIGTRFLALHSDYFANQQVADEGRFLVCHFAMALHDEYRPEDPDSGLTLARLVRRCVESRLMPAARVEGTVAILRRSRRLLDAPPGVDRRVRRMVPGPLLVAECTERVRLHFEAMEMVMPGRPWLRLLDQDPGFFWAVERERGVYFAERAQLFARLPALGAISEVEAGYVALVALLDAIAGPARPCDVMFPQAAVAERLSLPRAQLRRALQGLEQAGLIGPLANRARSIRIMPLAVETMAIWHATRLLRFDGCATRALAMRTQRGEAQPDEAAAC